MIFLARLSIRRPKLALCSWLATAAVLTLIGLGVSSTLSPSITVVPGTQSSRAQQLANDTFGPSQLVPILRGFYGLLSLGGLHPSRSSAGSSTSSPPRAPP